MDYQTDVGKPSYGIDPKLLENRIQKPVTVKVKVTGEAARRKLVISELEQIVGWDDKNGKYPLWRRFKWPIHIPTQWLEGWKEDLQTMYGSKFDKQKKLLELVKQSSD